MRFDFSCRQAHVVLAKYEKLCKQEGRHFDIITQNIDGLHQKAGSQNVLELHGALRKVVCTKCKKVDVNNDSPICEALQDRGYDCKRRKILIFMWILYTWF